MSGKAYTDLAAAEHRIVQLGFGDICKGLRFLETLKMHSLMMDYISKTRVLHTHSGLRGCSYQADEPKATVLVDEDLGGFAIFGEKLLHFLFRGASGQVTHEQPAALCVRLLPRFLKACQVDGQTSI